MPIVFMSHDAGGCYKDDMISVLATLPPSVRFEPIDTRIMDGRMLSFNHDSKPPAVCIVGEHVPLDEWLRNVDDYAGIEPLYVFSGNVDKDWMMAINLKRSFEDGADIETALDPAPLAMPRNRPSL